MTEKNVTENVETPVKRKRGRPKGSKNKKKVVVVQPVPSEAVTQ